MSDLDDIFGRDILLDGDGQAVVAANGELAWADGQTAAIQDLRLRITTYLGGLFYDRHFGSLVPDYIYDDNTKANRLSLAAEVKRRLELDPRVLAGSASAKILKWDDRGVTLEAAWSFWETATPQNLTITLERPEAGRALMDVSYDG